MRLLSLLLLGVLLTGCGGGGSSGDSGSGLPGPTDPWPGSPVETRTSKWDEGQWVGEDSGSSKQMRWE